MSEVNYQKWRKQISLHHYRDELLKRPRYQQEKRLIRFGYKVYSQSDEDGVLREIFARIGVAAGHFVESGYPLYSSGEPSYPWTRAVGGEDRGN